jgi:selenoprotein W-related protein
MLGPMTAREPRLEITYCTQCRWLLRASWLAQEVLTTFPTELGEVALVPGRGGVFEVRLGGRLIFARAEAGRFPEPKEIKQAVRDVVAPGRPLGHSDVKGGESASEPPVEGELCPTDE